MAIERNLFIQNLLTLAINLFVKLRFVCILCNVFLTTVLHQKSKFYDLIIYQF